MDARAVAEGRLVEQFPLHMARSSNVWAIIALVFVAPWAALSVVLAVGFMPRAFTGDLPGAVALAAVAAGFGWVVYRIFREAFPGRAHLGLTPNAIVLRHPLLLRRPLEIPLGDVERVAVSSTSSPGFWDPREFTLQKEHRGVTWVAPDDETAEALDITTRVLLPLASHVCTDEPNVAIVLRSPVDITGVRKKPISSGDLLVRRLCDVTQTRGFLARVQNPDAVSQAFAERCLLGKLSRDQDDLVEPSDADVKRVRRFRVVNLLWRVAALVWTLDALWRFLRAAAT